MNTYDQVIQLTNRMTLREKARLLEYLSTALRHDLDEAQSQPEVESARLRTWRATVEHTAGALANDPIERPPQGNYEQRDTIL